METTYFLFGLEASSIYIESDDIETYVSIANKIKATDFDVCKYTTNETNPVVLIDKAMGWSDYCVINEYMYKLLSK